MKKLRFFVPTVLAFLSFSSFSPNTMVIDIQHEVQTNHVEIFNRELSLINEKDHSGIRLSKDLGEGVVWLKDFEFSNGIVEFDMRGEDVKGHSFVGLAFHGQNSYTYDAIYLRPFQFRETDPVLRSHGIQYISLPDFTWRKLRAESPGKFENSIEPAPDPNAWVHVRIVIKDSTVSTFVNGSSEPSLVVVKVTRTKTGSLGFYVADTSGGDFANIIVTRTN